MVISNQQLLISIKPRLLKENLLLFKHDETFKMIAFRGQHFIKLLTNCENKLIYLNAVQNHKIPSGLWHNR